VGGYSLGSAVARKAILGGICLDNNQTLGSSLTQIISAYMSVAGANQGSVQKEKFYNLLFKGQLFDNNCRQLQCATTSQVSQLDPNICRILTAGEYFEFLKKFSIFRQRYEGQSIYMIGSTTDEGKNF
jgi:uncharacterized membrane protein